MKNRGKEREDLEKKIGMWIKRIKRDVEGKKKEGKKRK